MGRARMVDVKNVVEVVSVELVEAKVEEDLIDAVSEKSWSKSARPSYTESAIAMCPQWQSDKRVMRTS